MPLEVKIGIGLGVPLAFTLLVILAFLIFRYHRQQRRKRNDMDASMFGRYRPELAEINYKSVVHEMDPQTARSELGPSLDHELPARTIHR